MHNYVSERVKMDYHDHQPIELEVVGTWQYGGIVCAKVKHGQEFISASKYPSLYFTAVSLAEKMHRAYLADQADTKRHAVERLCGY